MIILALISLFFINQSRHDSLLPPLFVGILLLSTMVFIRLSKRSQQHYIQIHSNSMLVYRSILWSPDIYDISDFREVRRRNSIFHQKRPLVISLKNGRKIHLSHWWLTEDDLNRLKKVLERRIS
ncbi:MAG: hypothetical protein VYA34_04330 [Myxococcota bacterium]|nr:hypothetical protein [Myxococcota bacterium]